MKLSLKNNGDIAVVLYNPELKAEEEEVFPSDEEHQIKTISLLQYPIALENGYTVRSIFRMVTKYPALTTIDGFFPAYIDEYFACPQSGCLDDELAGVLFTMVVSVESGDMNTDVSVSGKGKEGDVESYAIDFTPLRELLDQPVILEDAMLVTEATPPNPPSISRFPYTYTLWEFLHAFIFEISFHGIPSERDSRMGDLRERVKEIEEGTAKCIPMDELFKEEEDEG